MRLLIVEDQYLIALDAETTLRSAGYDVVGIALSSKRAFELAERQKPDLVLVDIRLGDGDSGVEFARRLRAELAISSLFLTASGPEALAAQDAAIGLIVKPITPQLLVEGMAIAVRVLKGERVARQECPPGIQLFQVHGRTSEAKRCGHA